MALFHDQFQKERQLINKALFDWARPMLVEGKGGSKDLQKIVKDLVNMGKTGVKNEKVVTAVLERMPTEQKKLVQARILQFLKTHKNHLPYAR